MGMSTEWAPSRNPNQPGSPGQIVRSDGRLQAQAVSDGSGIWFAHDVDSGGFPTVQFGRIDIASSTVDRALAYHANASDDFNPSIGIGRERSGGTLLYLNWAYTDTSNNVRVSNVTDSELLPAGRPTLFTRVGTGVVTVTSNSNTAGQFGQYSSVVPDPAPPGPRRCLLTAS